MKRFAQVLLISNCNIIANNITVKSLTCICIFNLLVFRVNLSKPHTIAWSTENVIEHDKLATPCHCALTLRVALNKSWPWCLGPYLQWCIHQVAILGLWIINKLLKPNLKLGKAKGNTTLKLGLLTLVLTVTQVYVFVNLCQETALPPKPQNYEL